MEIGRQTFPAPPSTFWTSHDLVSLLPSNPRPPTPQQNSCFPSCNHSLLPFSSRPSSALKPGLPDYLALLPCSLAPSWPWKEIGDKRLAGVLHL